MARTRWRRSSSGSVSGLVTRCSSAARRRLHQPPGDLDLARLLVAGGEAAFDVRGHGARRRDAGVAAAGEVDGRRLVEELGQVARQARRLVGGLVDGAAEVDLVGADELAGAAGLVAVQVRAGAPGAGAHDDGGSGSDLGRAADRGGVGDEPSGGGEQRPAALVGLGLFTGEDRQRAEAVRPHPPLGSQGASAGSSRFS